MEIVQERYSWIGSDVFTLRFVGSNKYFKRFVADLAMDFTAPHFGHNGELFDEEE